MNTVTLTDSQHDRAVAIFEMLKEDEIQHPDDFLDSWKMPDEYVDYSEYDGTFPRRKEYIDPSKIEGVLGSTERLDVGRLAKVLKWMVVGDFEQEKRLPPMLQKRGSKYYVTDDGHHRSMAAKAVGLDELYAEVSEVPPEML